MATLKSKIYAIYGVMAKVVHVDSAAAAAILYSYQIVIDADEV